MTLSDRINEANQKAFLRIDSAHPMLNDVGIAGRTIPGMDKNTVLYAGPPARGFGDLTQPTQLAALCALVYEGLAPDMDSARQLAGSGEIKFDSALHHHAAIPHAGVISYSMPVWVVCNQSEGNLCYAAINCGGAESLTFGGVGPAVIERLNFVDSTVYAVLKESLSDHGPIDLRAMLAESLRMGDDGHIRTRAGSALLANALAAEICDTRFSSKEKRAALAFLGDNPRSFLGVAVASAKASVDPVNSIEYSTIVTAMARGSGQFGICVSGLGRRWFTAPVGLASGRLREGFAQPDAGPDCGDGSFLEIIGLGRSSLAGCFSSMADIGEDSKDAYNYSLRMYEICEGESSYYKLPSLNNRGAAVGIDLRKVVKTAIYPSVCSAICDVSGRGLIGYGVAPSADTCFDAAIRECYESWQ